MAVGSLSIMGHLHACQNDLFVSLSWPIKYVLLEATLWLVWLCIPGTCYATWYVAPAQCAVCCWLPSQMYNSLCFCHEEALVAKVVQKMLLSLVQLSLGLKWDLRKLGLLVHIPARMVVTPSATISGLQLACSIAQSPLLMRPRLWVWSLAPECSKPSVFTNACHWIPGAVCRGRSWNPFWEKQLSDSQPELSFWTAKDVFISFHFPDLDIWFWFQTFSE